MRTYCAPSSLQAFARSESLWHEQKKVGLKTKAKLPPMCLMACPYAASYIPNAWFSAVSDVPDAWLSAASSVLSEALLSLM